MGISRSGYSAWLTTEAKKNPEFSRRLGLKGNTGGVGGQVADFLAGIPDPFLIAGYVSYEMTKGRK